MKFENELGGPTNPSSSFLLPDFIGEKMNKNVIYALVGLVVLWVILIGAFSPASIIIGVLVGAGCLYFSRKMIPLKKIEGVNFLKLILYPFYLIGEIYWMGFLVIRMILTGARVDIVDVETKLKCDVLITILLNSITLTPGSIPLDLKDDVITVLNLGCAKSEDAHEAVDNLRGRLEKRLIKAQE